MGKGTSKAGGGTAAATRPGEGMTGTEFAEKYGRYGETKALIKDFGLEDATPAQISALQQVIRDIPHYDDYGEGVKIKSVYIEHLGQKKTKEEIAQEKELYGRAFRSERPISVGIGTTSNSDSAMIRIMDSKTRSFLIGSRGGYFTYSRTTPGKKVTISSFDARHGKHDY